MTRQAGQGPERSGEREPDGSAAKRRIEATLDGPGISAPILDAPPALAGGCPPRSAPEPFTSERQHLVPRCDWDQPKVGQ